MLKIMIADNHPVIRYVIKRFISDEEDMIVNGEAENGKEVLKLLKENDFDILILDINLPDINCFEVLDRIKYSAKNIPVLVLSIIPDENYAVRVIKAGASGYLNKMAATEQLISAIKKISSGGYYINPSSSDNLVFVSNAD